jgi:CitB family two-component system sensor histidine kinase MalK
VNWLHRKRFKLSTIIIFFVCIVVILSLVITDLLISNTVNEDIRRNLEDKAKIVSRTVAKSNIVVAGLEDEQLSRSIQDYALDIQTATNVLFVVVMDMDGIRKSHPDPEKIGEHFVGGDEKGVLEGREYISISKGTLGNSVRAFTPIYNTLGEQIGAVAVGISIENVDQALGRSHKNIITGTIIGIIVGIIGAILLARYIKKTLLGLEPFAIAKILEERSTMLQSVHEGIVAVDHDSTITLVNKSALHIFQKARMVEEPIGMKISDFMSSSKLERVMNTAKPELDVEQNINGVSILVNHVPLVVKGQVVGAISTFRDKTEVNQLAEQLTGVKTYAEALRAQSHEFMNKLHVIVGMVRMEFYDELSEFINSIVHHRNQELGSITQNIKDPAIAGFLMGKLSYAREENVELIISSKTTIPEPASSEITHGLVTIIGNLIDNAVESMSTSKERIVELNFMYDKNYLTLEVIDTGSGIRDEQISMIFEKGFSSKGEDRGFGLHIVAQTINALQGRITVDSNSKGTTFYVEVPYDIKRVKK